MILKKCKSGNKQAQMIDIRKEDLKAILDMLLRATPIALLVPGQVKATTRVGVPAPPVA